ncbi:MAG: patatin-like phospholipase family protein [Clostridia bacterium]
MSLGLALSGGGAKGAAHIGVLQALKEENIKIDYISGTSSGSIIATLFACGYEPLEILRLFRTYCSEINDADKLLPIKVVNTMFTGKLNIQGLAKGDNLENLIKSYTKVKGIKDITQISFPIVIPAVDIDTGEIIYFLNKKINTLENKVLQSRNLYDDNPTYKYYGDIDDIVRASCSLPAVFLPKKIEEHLLVDGGIRINTPVSILKDMGASKVLAVCFDTNRKGATKPNNIINIAIKSFDIMGHQSNFAEISNADLVIRPDLKNIGLLDCKKIDYIARQGYLKTKEMIEKIKEMAK